MHPNVIRIALVCPYTCACNAVLRAPPFKAPSKAHFLIPFKGLILLIFIKNGWSIYRRRKLPYIFLSHFIPFYYHRQTHPFPTSLPSSQRQPRCDLSPPLLFCACPHMSALPNTNPSLSEANKRFLRDLGITGPSGEHLPYWDQIPHTRFLFDFW